MWGSAIGSIVMLTLGLLVVPCAAEAQPPATVARIGWLSDGMRASASSHLHEAFLHGLRDPRRCSEGSCTIEQGERPRYQRWGVEMFQPNHGLQATASSVRYA